MKITEFDYIAMFTDIETDEYFENPAEFFINEEEFHDVMVNKLSWAVLKGDFKRIEDIWNEAFANCKTSLNLLAVGEKDTDWEPTVGWEGRFYDEGRGIEVDVSLYFN